MELFSQNLTAQKNKIEADFEGWRKAIASRKPRDAKRSAEKVKNRIERLRNFLDADYKYIEVLRDHTLTLESNEPAREELGLKSDMSQISRTLISLFDLIGHLLASIANIQETLKTRIGIEGWANNSNSYSENHNEINNAWNKNLPSIEACITQEILIVSKDVRNLMKSKNLGREHRGVLELLIRMEEEMKKLK